MSSDFFYEPPEWFKTYRTGIMNSTLPYKVHSKSFGLYLYRDSTVLQNDFHPSNGSRLIIHNTDEFPFRSGQHVQHKTNEMLHIDYTPSLTVVDKKLTSWPPEQRNCFMEHEKKLKYFKIYTKVNCEHECLSDAILQTCGCVPFYIISEFQNL